MINMEQRSLRVVSTNKNFFTKLTNTISRLLIPTKWNNDFYKKK